MSLYDTIEACKMILYRAENSLKAKSYDECRFRLQVARALLIAELIKKRRKENV